MKSTFDPGQIKTALLSEFPNKRVLVIGDVILDQYIRGTASRVSEEAPVLVLHVAQKQSVLGAAANVARNLASLGVSVDLGGFVGDDRDADLVRQLCDENGIGRQCLAISKNSRTTVKTRVLAAEKQLLRIDEEDHHSFPYGDQSLLLSALDGYFETINPDAVIISDYNKGVCTESVCQRLIEICLFKGIPIYVDPKGANWKRYRGANSIKPNVKEMQDLAREMGWDPSPEHAAEQLLKWLDLDFVAHTLGPDGMVLVTWSQTTRMPVEAKEVFDVSGAGDTVIATMTAGLCAGLNLWDAATLANVAAGYVVSKMGTTVVSTEELLVALQSRTHSEFMLKSSSPEQIQILTNAWRKKGYRFALLRGSFQSFGANHVRLIERAAHTADRLIVAIQTNNLGENEPEGVNDRAILLSALERVDAVVTFGDDLTLKLIESIQPNVYVAIDEELDHEAAAKIVAAYGGTFQDSGSLETQTR